MSNSDHDYDVQQPLTEPVEPAPLTQDVDPPQLPPDGIRRLSPPPGLGDHNGLALHDDHAEEPMDFDGLSDEERAARMDSLVAEYQQQRELVVRATRRQDELVALMAELTVSSSADVRQSTPKRKSSSEEDGTPPKLSCNVSRQASNDPLQRRDSQRSSPSPDSRSRNNRSSQLNNRNRSPMTVLDELEAPPTPEHWKKLPGRTEFNDNYPEPWKKLPGAHSNNRQNRSPDRLRSRSPCASSATCHHHRSPDRRRSRSPPASSRQRSRSPLVVNNRSQSRNRQPGPHRQCSFCGRWHYTAECPFVTSNEERMRIMDENKLCYRCLYPHRDPCRSSHRCSICNSTTHHQAICSLRESKKNYKKKPPPKD